MSKRRPRTFKDTFWCRKRVEQNITVQEIADAVHLSTGIVGMYLTGQRMPTDATIKQICDLFDVDFLEGKSEFTKACKLWDSEPHRVVKYRSESNPNGTVVEGKVEAWYDEDGYQLQNSTPKGTTDTSMAKKPQNVPESVLEVLYGKLPQKAFRAILEGTESEIDPLEYLYDKVDFDDYMKIYNAMKEVK